AVVFDALPDDDLITGEASFKSIRKKIKKEMQQALGQQPKPPAPSPQPMQPCTDSDNTYFVSSAGGGSYNPPGDDRYVAGTVTYGQETHNDYCTNKIEFTDNVGNRLLRYDKVDKGTHIIEQGCIDGKTPKETTPFPCPHGCQNGACLRPFQQPQIIENAWLTLSNRITTKFGGQIDINSIPPDETWRPTFKIEHQGIKEYRPIYTIEIIDKNNQVLYKKTYATELIKENGFLEITEVINYEDSYGKNLKLQSGESYTLKVSISQKQGETNLADNEQTLQFKVGAPTRQQTAKLKEETARPKATYSTQPSTTTVILPPEVGV
ncbi:hypothetical protein HY484_01380, partial [Candidatus Woesearchaeota archaeon]|nr:hypothetical protein [Candidatus Woesearchaeota archaeon]